MTKDSSYGTDRKTAVVVGILFILGTVPALLSLPLAQNTVNAPDHLTAISTNIYVCQCFLPPDYGFIAYPC